MGKISGLLLFALVAALSLAAIACGESQPGPGPPELAVVISPAATPTEEPTSTATPFPTLITEPPASPTPSPTAIPTPSPTPEPTATPTPTPTLTPKPTPSSTPTPSPTPTATPKPTATATPRPTATASPQPTATRPPTPTATPATSPLTAAEIFAQVSPSVAFIETSVGTGSGLLIDGGYVVTNAHVVWPFDEARVVFPDGSEFLDAPVANWDLLGDLAILGPLDTSIGPLDLVGGEDLAIGSDVFLVGYPGEAEEFPQPTISGGLISRLREWEAIGMTYLQTDAALAGGQSGGVLVSEDGDVIGISGLFFADAFALVASASDVLPRVQRLISGEDVSGLGDRRVPDSGGALEHELTLNNEWYFVAYVCRWSAKMSG